MTIRPKSTAALIQVVRIAKTNQNARFPVRGSFDMTSSDVLAMWSSGLMARCNRGLTIGSDDLDLRWDAMRINEYIGKRIRNSGCRNLLRTAKMKARYPHIDNQAGH